MTVIVVGSINLDMLVRTPRHPGAGETVTGHSLDTGVGGKGLNQAIAAARAGARVAMIGAVGSDDGGTAALDALLADGVSTDRVAVRNGERTGTAVVTVDDSGENSIIVIPGTNATMVPDAMAGLLSGTQPGDVVLLQNELPAAATVTAAALARDAGATVVWNAAPAPVAAADIPGRVDVLVVNEHELRVVSDLLGIDDDDSRMRSVGERLGAVVVCTLGSAGSVVVDGERRESVAAIEVDVVDTTAAGDTFIGYLVADSIINGITAAHLTRAGTAAGLTVTRPGASASIPSRRDVDGFSPHARSTS